MRTDGYSSSILIDKTIDVVWDVITNPANFEHILANYFGKFEALNRAQARPGTVFRSRSVYGEKDIYVVGWEPPTYFSWGFSPQPGANFEHRFSLKDLGQKTLLSHTRFFRRKALWERLLDSVVGDPDATTLDQETVEETIQKIGELFA